MKYQYYTCDVFTNSRFGGNPLAVVPEADGLTDEQMQKIAQEFNYSETSFVLPAAESLHSKRVRIFTPTIEVPFAGHPNIGTACTLASKGVFGTFEDSITVSFEEDAGIVPITIQRVNGEIRAELKAPQAVSIAGTISAEQLAEIVSLTPDDAVTSTHLPQTASVGLPFLVAQLRNREVLSKARVRIDKLEGIVTSDIPGDILVYALGDDGDFDIYARMFAPLDNVPEDPATGSANCALVGLLSSLNSIENGSFSWRIAQGVEMGRPSVLEARTEKKNGIVTGVWIGGASVMVCEGWIEV